MVSTNSQLKNCLYQLDSQYFQLATKFECVFFVCVRHVAFHVHRSLPAITIEISKRC